MLSELFAVLKGHGLAVVDRDGTPLFSQIFATSHLQPPCHPVRLFTGASESNGFVKIAYPVWYNQISVNEGSAIWSISSTTT